jgi:hypothetical protein
MADEEDYEPSVCDVCGRDKHTIEELAECFNSAVWQPEEEVEGHFGSANDPVFVRRKEEDE